MPADTLTTAQWVSLVTWYLSQGREMTTREIAALGNRTPRTAYTMMCAISGYPGWPVYQDKYDNWRWKLCKVNRG